MGVIGGWAVGAEARIHGFEGGVFKRNGGLDREATSVILEQEACLLIHSNHRDKIQVATCTRCELKSSMKGV